MLLDAIADNGLRGSWPDHPVFGRMSSGQWLEHGRNYTPITICDNSE